MSEPLVPSDLYAIVQAFEPQITADGSAVFFRRSTFDRERDRIAGAIWRVDANGAARAFTGGTNDRLPRLSPDGTRLAFVGESDEKRSAVYVMPVDGGVATMLPGTEGTITALVWSPDGSSLALAASAPFDAVTARIYVDETSGARHIRRLPFKSDADGLLSGVRKHLVVYDIAAQLAETITSGDFDVASPSWSPDGTRIAFAAQIDRREDSFVGDIHLVDLKTRKRTMLTRGDGPMQSPVFSHDGATIACVGHQRGDDLGGRFNTELYAIDLAAGTLRSLTADLDRTVGNALVGDMRSGASALPVWSADDREIFVQISDEGSCGIRAVPVAGGAPRIVAGGEREVYGFSLAASGALAIAYSAPVLPSELAVVEPYGGETVLTHLNDAWLKKKTLFAPKRFRPKSADGKAQLDGWILKPPGKSTTPIPLVLEVHGGPHAAYGYTFFLEFQVLAGAGMAVAYGNPRGGQSYGAAFADAITGDWGGIDADDVLRILDGALKLAPVDTARIGLAGGSYGGFMTTWLLGHSDRFAAGVSMRAVNDFVSEAGASDLGWFLEAEIGGRLADDGGQKLFDNSPMRAAANINVPLLIDHSERDYRCPIDQGEQLFTLLRRLDKLNVEFVRFTNDGHELSRGGRPRSRVLRLRAIAHWFIRHLKPAGLTGVVDEAGSLFRPLPHESES